MTRYKTQDWVILALIILVTVGLRLFLALQVPYVIGEESFHWQHQVQSIKESGRLGSIDEFYAGHRKISTFPLFAYILTIPSLFGPFEIWGKICSNIFGSLIVVAVFLITKNVTKKDYVVYLTSFFAGFIPVFLEQTVHKVSIYSLVLPLFVWCIYCFLAVTAFKKKHLAGVYAASLIFFGALHPSVLIFVGGVMVYLIILKVERLKITKAELELVIFTLIVVPIMQVLIYRELLLAHGLEIVWQNIPDQIIGRYFSDIALLDAFYKIGEIPVLFGLIIIAKYVFKEKDKIVSLLVSFALVVGAALWFKLIVPSEGMMFLGAILVLLFSFYYTLYLNYVPSTKFEKFLPVLKAVLFGTFILTSILPAVSLVNHTVYQARWGEHSDALKWIAKNADDGAIIVADEQLGAMIVSATNRSVISDTNFLFVQDAQERLDDIEKVYTSPYESAVIEVMGKYRAEYIYIDPVILQAKYNRTNVRFLPNNKPTDCFEKVFDENITIFRRVCSLRVLA